MFMGTKMKDFLKYLLTLIFLNPLVFSQGGLTLKNDNAQVSLIEFVDFQDESFQDGTDQPDTAKKE